MEMSVINQKEYLKKYLSSGDDKGKSKKRRRKSRIFKDRVKIIDDDIDLSTTNMNEDDFREFLTAEDAPQVVGIVDDRPPAMRVDDYRKSDKWKLVGSDEDEKESNKNKNEQTVINTITIKNKLQSKKVSLETHEYLQKSSDSGCNSFKNVSSKNRSTQDSDSDLSPPPRSLKAESKQEIDSDISPPRKSRRNENSDSDLSPARPNKKINSNENEKKRRRYSSDRDFSPRRRRNKYLESNEKPHNREKEKTKRYESVSHPVRRRNRWDDGDTSKKEQDLKKHSISSDRQTDKQPLKATDPKSKKMSKTLDGKSAGLQNADELKRETDAFKKREDDLFKKMTVEVSGANAVPIMRDRKTGKRRDFEKEAQEEIEKKKKIDEQKEKYSRWGKGLKQVDEQKSKMEQELYEMSKPLARYADDEDLETYLKEQEREGDPMLQYIKKKKRKEALASGAPLITKPQYEGEFMPNRFGIPPGHRWDGVDRSNGYETNWFATQNAKKAVEEDVYKWSTEDM